jgi:large subunit ribosomal protein L4
MSLNIDILNIQGETVGSVALPKDVFGAKINPIAVAQFVRVFSVNQTQGTHKTKTKGEVSGGGKKPYAQKHTGRARRGSNRSPIVVGGGISHGPVPHTKRLKLSKNQKKTALVSVLSEKALNGDIICLDSLPFDKPKTSQMVKIIKNIKAKENCSFVLSGGKDKENYNKVVLSTRNIKNARIFSADNINVFDILGCQSLVVEKDAIGNFERRVK